MHNNEFRRGDTFSYAGEATLRDQYGAEIDMTGAVGASQLRTQDGTKITDLYVELIPGHVSLKFFGDTSGWPLGKALIDVQVTMPNGEKVGTNKDVVEIVEGVTR